MAVYSGDKTDLEFVHSLQKTVNMEFEGGITAAFSMEGLTSYGGRRTRIMGTRGDLVGDERRLDVYDFAERRRYEWTVAEHGQSLGGHGGGDFGLVRDWVQAISRRDESLLTSTLAASMESHLIGFAAERSRETGQSVDLAAFRAEVGREARALAGPAR